MYGTPIGKITQPLDNLVVNEVEGSEGLKHVYLTISAKNLPSGNVIAKRIADYSSSRQNIGELLVETNDLGVVSFQKYLDDVSKMSEGDVNSRYSISVALALNPLLRAIGIDNKIWLFCIARTTPDKPTKLLYVLAINATVEGAIRLTEGILQPRYSVLGYELTDTSGNEIDDFVTNAVKIVEETKELSAPVTLEQLAFMRQIVPIIES